MAQGLWDDRAGPLALTADLSFFSNGLAAHSGGLGRMEHRNSYTHTHTHTVSGVLGPLRCGCNLPRSTEEAWNSEQRRGP